MTSTSGPNYQMSVSLQRRQESVSSNINSYSQNPDIQSELQKVTESIGFDEEMKSEFKKNVYRYMAESSYSIKDAEAMAARNMAEKHFDNKILVEKLDEVFELDIGSNARFVSHSTGIQATSPHETRDRFYDAAVQTQLDDGISLEEAKKNADVTTAIFFFDSLNNDFLNRYGVDFTPMDYSKLEETNGENNVYYDEADYQEYGFEFDAYIPRREPDEIQNYIEQMYAKYSFITDNPDIARTAFDGMIQRAEDSGFSNDQRTFDGYMTQAEKTFKYASIAHKAIQNYPVFEKLDIRG